MTAEPSHKILVLTPSLPYPPIWGFGIRVYQIVKNLAARHQVTLLTYGKPDQASSVAVVENDGVQVHLVSPPHEEEGKSKRLAQMTSLFSPVSFQRRGLQSPEMQNKLTSLLDGEQYDIIQVESSQMSGFDFGNRSKILIDEHNIEYELLHRMYTTEKSPVRKLYNWLEYEKFKREEQACWRSADGIVFTSDREEAILQSMLPSAKSTVAPNGVDVDYFCPVSDPPDLNSIVLTGLMRYRPNIDAAIYFVREILPLIVAKRPQTVFSIVGAGPPEEVLQLAGPNVVVTGTVDDVRPYQEKAGVLVVPLRMGSGTRLKVLEGLSMSKAMVSTSLGCEGIGVEHKKHLLIADEPKTFADSVLQLIGDQELSHQLGAAGRDLALGQYSWKSVVAGLEKFYDRLLS